MRFVQCDRAGPVNLVFGRHTSDFSEIVRYENTHKNELGPDAGRAGGKWLAGALAFDRRQAVPRCGAMGPL